MGNDLPPVIRCELGRLAKLGFLDESEAIDEAEDVKLNERTGALVVTDRRILFVRTSLIRRRTHVHEVSLEDVRSLEAAADPVWDTRRGRLTIALFGADQAEPLEFARIRGGKARAEEIARTIEPLVPRFAAFLTDRQVHGPGPTWP